MGRPRSCDYAAVETDWFDRTLDAEAVARKHNVVPGVVRNIWSLAIAEGRIPSVNRLKYFNDNPPAAVATDGYEIDAAAEAAFAREIDRGESADCRVPDGDPLLARLQKHHGNDPRRDFDDIEDGDCPTEIGSDKGRQFPSRNIVALLAQRADHFNAEMSARRK